MEPILTIHDRRFRLHTPKKAIHDGIARVAGEINRDYASAERPLMLVTLNGAFVFAGELFRQLTGPFEVAFVKLSSYEGLGTSGNVKIDVPLTTDISGRDVIIAEDVVDTGNTIHKLHVLLTDQGAKSVRVATLLLKPETYYNQPERPEPLPIDYIALESEPAFIIGYGMDYDGLGRNLGALYVVCEEK